MENSIKNIINNPQSFGNFNSVLFFEIEEKNINGIYENIVKNFIRMVQRRNEL
jgi:hypothetical protein